MEGKIVAPDGRTPVHQARVTLNDINGRYRGSLVTDDEGTFVFYDLPAGLYILNVTHAQYEETSERIELSVTPLRNLRVSLRAPASASRKGAETLSLAPSSSPSVPVWAMKIPADSRKEYEAGLEEMKAGEWKKCVEHMEAAVALYPQYAAAYSAMATAHLRLEHRKAAEDAYASALKVDDNLVDANLGLGALYSADKRLPEAERLLLRANLVKSDDWRILFELGQLYWRMEKLASAEENLSRAKALHPELARTYLLLMNVLATRDKLPESLAVMDEYLALFPKDSFATQVQKKRDQLKAHLAANPPAEPRP